MTIGVIFTGGTIGSAQSAVGLAPSGEAPRRLLADYQKRTGDGTRFPTAEPYSILSENLTFSNITRLAECIKERSREWDGIIVTHGTDTLQYTATALSYLLGLKTTPIVLVSSNYPLEDARANGLDNFCGAVDFLRQLQGVRGVYVAYKNAGEALKIHRGSRVLAHPAFSDDIVSLGSAAYEQKDGNFVPVDGFFEHEDAQAPFHGTDLTAAEGKVLFLRVYPGMVYPSLDGIRAVLLKTYHSGTLATDSAALQRFAEDAKAKGIPVFLTGVPEGGTAYASGTAFTSLGLIPAPPISPIAAYMKLCLAVGEGRDLQKALALPLGGDL
ncbi:MAG: asparaginase [Clostridia bacterium]|nr:asparaginase [Clostridia bacterium]